MIFKEKYPFQEETEEGFAWLPITARSPEHDYAEVTVWLQKYKVSVKYIPKRSPLTGSYLEKEYGVFL